MPSYRNSCNWNSIRLLSLKQARVALCRVALVLARRPLLK